MAKASIELEGIDILVNNADGPSSGHFHGFTREDWQSAVNLALYTALAMTKELLPGMTGRGWGGIINLTSMSVKQPIDGLLLSNSTRAAVVGRAKNLADEVAAVE